MSNRLPLPITTVIATALSTLALALTLPSCAPTAKSTPPSGALIRLDAALTAAVSEIASRSQLQSHSQSDPQSHDKIEIAVSKIEAPTPAISEHISGELSARLFATGKFIVLERSGASQAQARDAVSDEHLFQMSGSVADSSIVGLGGHLGAKIVVTGALTRFTAFCQLRLQAQNVLTAQIISQYTARIPLGDVGLR